MDEEEDEDNTAAASPRSSNWKNMSGQWTRTNRDNRKLAGHTSRDLKFFENFLIWLVFNSLTWRWYAFADSLEPINQSPTRSKFIGMPRIDDYSNAGDEETVPDRRIRHDTIRGAASKRFISFEPPSNSVPYVVEPIANSSVDDSSDDQYIDQLEPETIGPRNDTVPVYNSANSVSPAMSNESCTCTMDRKKLSRAFHSVTISLRHPRLNVSEGIIGGVLYEGRKKFHFFIVSS